MKLNPLFALLFVATHSVVKADDFTQRCADRKAIERVYRAHQLRAAPSERIEQTVQSDAHKERVLQRVYGVEITPAMLAAEVHRIATTTPAPKVLAEIRRALGNSTARFSLSVAQPILVERELRRCFENDAALHAPERHEAEQARAAFLAGKAVAHLREIVWQLTPRIPFCILKVPAPAQPITHSTVDPAVQFEHALAASEFARIAQGPLYFSEMDPELLAILRPQLQRPGDVSAVIELRGGFFVFAVKERTKETLATVSLSIPKRSYATWLAEQP